MKTCNDNHLQMANQKFYINQGGDKMNLKTFNSKRLKKSCYRFLSSIFTLSILSVANSSFAFPAQVKPNNPAPLYRAPGQRKFSSMNPDSIVDILYCRSDSWCYISGYYSQGTHEPVGYRNKSYWTESDSLCDKYYSNTNPLEDCDNRKEKDSQINPAIQASISSFKNFFCSNQKNNPWTWFLPVKVCQNNKNEF